MKNKLPYYSQHDDTKEEEWKSRSCAIVCIKMILEFFSSGSRVPTIEELIEEGARIGGLNEKKDWLHEKLVQLLRNHGVSSYRQEFFGLNKIFENGFLEKGLHKISIRLQEEYPVIVSVPRKFEEGGSFHMVVLTGFDVGERQPIEGFYYNDPDYHGQKGKKLFVDIETFKKLWRRMAIFTE